MTTFRGVSAGDVTRFALARATNKIGLHDEALFIDYIDHDISLRANRAGFTNLEVFDTLLDHRFGDSEPTYFLGRKVYLSNHSPTRRYYSARNRIIVLRCFGAGLWFREELGFTTRAVIKMVLAEHDRPRKVKAALRRLVGGFRFRLR